MHYSFFIFLVVVLFSLGAVSAEESLIKGITVINEKQKMEFVPEEFSENNLLNQEINQSIPVIIIFKNQPIKSVPKKNKDLSELKNQITQIYKKAVNLSEKKIKEMGIQKAHESRLNSLSKKDRNRLKQLKKQIKNIKKQNQKQIVEKIEQKTQKDKNKIKNILNKCNATITTDSSIISSVSAIINKKCLKKLKKSNLIQAVYEDKIVKTELNHASKAIYTQTFYNQNYFGSSDIAVVDTGIDSSHPNLNVIAENVFHNSGKFKSNYEDDPADPDDFHGHGTHIAGIIASSDSIYRGISPNSNLINAKFGYLTTNGWGEGTTSDSMKAIDWAIQQGADVISYSFGSSTSSDDCSNCRFMDAVVDDLEIPVIVAAGNSGPNLKTINSPAIAYNVMAVGAINDKNTDSRSDDEITPYSSRGPTKAGRIKPDIVAPGNKIMATNAFWEDYSNFIEKSGTSMACPMVAAAVSLIQDANPNLGPKAIKALLINTAEDFPDKDKYGWGYLNLDHAYYHLNNIKTSIIYERNQNPNVKFYKGPLQTNDKATLVWNRHVIYNQDNYPSKYYQLNDIDLRLFDEENNELIDESISGVDNVEQVKADNDYNNAVIKVESFDSNFYLQDYEEYALATEENIIEVSPPNLTIAQNLPQTAESGFIITATITNKGGAVAHDIGITLNLPSGLTIASGNNPQTIERISSQDSITASWTIIASTSKTYSNIYTEFESESYGETYTGQTPADSIFINQSSPQDTIPPKIAILAPINNSLIETIPFNLIVQTDENAICSYKLSLCSQQCSNLIQEQMEYTGTKLHSQQISNLQDTKDQYYKIQINCRDFSSNQNSALIIFALDACASNWQPQDTRCKRNDTQTRYYIDINNCNEPETRPPDEAISCDYCTPDWILKNASCLKNDIKIGYFIDQNNCYEKTKLPSDNNPPQNKTYRCDYQGFIAIISPENKTYKTKRVPLITSTLETVDSIYYSLNSHRPRRLCRLCQSYNKLRSFREGFNSLKIIAKTNFQEYEKTINFTIDSKPPKIRKLYPKNKAYAKGAFKIQYYEPNLKKITLYYGNSMEATTNCQSGKKAECVFNVDLSQYEAQTINYYFILEDQVSSTASKTYSIKIDTTPPEIRINNPTEDQTYGKYLYLDIKLSEKVKYLTYIHNGRERRLCSRCSSYHKRKAFSRGQQNITIKAADYAKNVNQKNISFYIDY